MQQGKGCWSDLCLKMLGLGAGPRDPSVFVPLWGQSTVLSHGGGTEVRSPLSATEEDEKAYLKPIKPVCDCQVRKSPGGVRRT